MRSAGRACGRKLVGLVLEERGVLRGHQKVVVPGVGEGELTSGTFSPTLERSIGFARVPAATGERVDVDIRGKLLARARRQVSVRPQRQSLHGADLLAARVRNPSQTSNSQGLLP